MNGNINLNSVAKVTNCTAPILTTDVANKIYTDTGNNYEPPIIKSLNPYLHLVADAYSSVTATSGVFDLSSNNQTITYAGLAGGTIVATTDARGHQYLTMTNQSVLFTRSTNIYTAFIVMKYNNRY